MTTGVVVAAVTSPHNRSSFGPDAEDIGRAVLGFGGGLFAGGVAGAFIRTAKWQKIMVGSRPSFTPEPAEVPSSTGIANRTQVPSWTLGFGAGTGIPRGEFAGHASRGFLSGVDFDYWTTEKVAVGLDGSFISNNSSDAWEAAMSAATGTPATGNTTMLQGGVHLKGVISEATTSPFFLIGPGVYRVRDRVESADPFYASDGAFQSYLGTRAGLGLRHRTSDTVAINIESDLHWVWTSWDQALKFISVRAGMSIGMGTRLR